MVGNLGVLHAPLFAQLGDLDEVHEAADVALDVFHADELVQLLHELVQFFLAARNLGFLGFGHLLLRLAVHACPRRTVWRRIRSFPRPADVGQILQFLLEIAQGLIERGVRDRRIAGSARPLRFENVGTEVEHLIDGSEDRAQNPAVAAGLALTVEHIHDPLDLIGLPQIEVTVDGRQGNKQAVESGDKGSDVLIVAGHIHEKSRRGGSLNISTEGSDHRFDLRGAVAFARDDFERTRVFLRAAEVFAPDPDGAFLRKTSELVLSAAGAVPCRQLFQTAVIVL